MGLSNSIGRMVELQMASTLPMTMYVCPSPTMYLPTHSTDHYLSVGNTVTPFILLSINSGWSNLVENNQMHEHFDHSHISDYHNGFTTFQHASESIDPPVDNCMWHTAQWSKPLLDTLHLPVVDYIEILRYINHLRNGTDCIDRNSVSPLFSFLSLPLPCCPTVNPPWMPWDPPPPTSATTLDSMEKFFFGQMGITWQSLDTNSILFAAGGLV